MVEQWTHKPLDVGSNPTLATIYLTLMIGCGFPLMGTHEDRSQIPPSPLFF